MSNDPNQDEIEYDAEFDDSEFEDDGSDDGRPCPCCGKEFTLNSLVCEGDHLYCPHCGIQY